MTELNCALHPLPWQIRSRERLHLPASPWLLADTLTEQAPVLLSSFTGSLILATLLCSKTIQCVRCTYLVSVSSAAYHVSQALLHLGAASDFFQHFPPRCTAFPLIYLHSST
jgi:hypothetical protein